MESGDIVRLLCFFGIFLLMATVEFFVPGRELSHGRSNRWVTSWSIVILDSVLVRIVFPLGGYGLALWAESQSIGFFNFVGVVQPIAILIAFLVLDWSIWFTHYLSHKIPILWRVHSVHHADPDMDVTTAIRFHPIEILLSMAWKSVIILLLGAPAISVIIFEIVLNGGAMFNHTNIRLPAPLEKVLRLFIVTPDMHRVHHSQRVKETDSNYGFSLSIWDRIFGTYTAQPQDGHEKMKIGLDYCDANRSTKLFYTLSIPFYSKQRESDLK